MYTTIAQIKRKNKEVGHHWFEPATMSFFNSKVYDKVYHGKYFITSEQCRWEGVEGKRLYSIRQCEEDGSIDTVGEFQGYSSLEDAKEAVMKLEVGQ